LGSARSHQVNVRVVAATNRDLLQMIGDKGFRADLYYRLSVFPVILPPLRERPEDIPALVRHFAAKYAERMNKAVEAIPSKTMEAMLLTIGLAIFASSRISLNGASLSHEVRYSSRLSTEYSIKEPGSSQ